ELEPERAELLYGDDHAARRADLRHLLDRDEGHQRRSTQPAVSLFMEQSENLMIAEQLDDVPWELRRPVDLGGARRNPLARELADQFADLALLVGQRIGRQRPESSPGCRAGMPRAAGVSMMPPPVAHE